MPEDKVKFLVFTEFEDAFIFKGELDELRTPVFEGYITIIDLEQMVACNSVDINGEFEWQELGEFKL